MDKKILLEGIEGSFELIDHERAMLADEEGVHVEYYILRQRGPFGENALLISFASEADIPISVQDIMEKVFNEGMNRAKQYFISKLNNNSHIRAGYYCTPEHTAILIGRSNKKEDYDFEEFRRCLRDKTRSWGLIYDEEEKKVIDFSEDPIAG